MKVGKKTANMMLIAGACLGIVLFFVLQHEYPRIANYFGNPPWLGGLLTSLIIGCGILGALSLSRKPKRN
jgi:hypothetical protein